MHASGYAPLKYLELHLCMHFFSPLSSPEQDSLQLKLRREENARAGNKQQRRNGKGEALERNIKTEVKGVGVRNVFLVSLFVGCFAGFPLSLLPFSFLISCSRLFVLPFTFHLFSHSIFPLFKNPLPILSPFCLLSHSSSLFLFSALTFSSLPLSSSLLHFLPHCTPPFLLVSFSHPPSLTYLPLS